MALMDMNPTDLYRALMAQQAWGALGNMGAGLTAAGSATGVGTPPNRGQYIAQGMQGAQQSLTPDPQMIQGLMQAQQQQSRDEAFRNALMGGGPQMAQGAPQGGQQEAMTRWQVGDETGALNTLYEDPKAPTMRDFKEGDEIVTKQFDPRKKEWVEVARAPRYRPETNVSVFGDAYKPQTPVGKAWADRTYLTKELGYPEDHPSVQALDREIATAGKPSGEAARFTEMAETGAQTVDQIMDAYLPEGPEGDIDQSVTAGAYANLPFTQERATRAQFEEAASFILRMETGAQANPAEIQNVADRYKPKPWDPPEVQKDKLMRLKRRFENATSIQRTGELGQEDIPAKATSTATGPSGQKAYLVEGKWVDETGKPIEGQ